MNKDQLKELVKQHFNLVDYPATVTENTEEKFGELYDENKAFKIVFPGDVLKVGDEVKVVTTDGQESLAPDGYHKLEDGTMIKTEGSSVVEIVNPETEKAEEEMASEEFAADPAISQVEGTTSQNATTKVDDLKMGPTVEEVMAMIDEKMASMKEEMAKMKTKFEELAAAPASSKTMASAGKTKMDSFSTATNDTAIKMARELMKKKNK